MPGDYFHVQAQNTRKSVRYDVDGEAESAAVLLAPKSANHRLFIQRIVWSIATHAAKTLTFIDDHAGTDTNIAAHTDATAAAGIPSVVAWDFGPHGLPLTKGASLTLTGNASGSGSTGVVAVEGYEKLEGPVALSAS